MSQHDQQSYAPRAGREGTGYYKGKGLQWMDLCPHMGASEARLMRVLVNLVMVENPRRNFTLEELRHLVYAGPVEVGQSPKHASLSGVRRMLRSLAELGQITTYDDDKLTFSSGKAAQSRPIGMQVWRYPRHECLSRTVFDGLVRVRNEQGLSREREEPRWPLAGPDMAPPWPPAAPGAADEAPPQPPAEEPGQISDQVGQNDDQPGQEDDHAGQKTDQKAPGDLREAAPPSSSPSCSPSFPPSPPAPPRAQEPPTPSERTEEQGREENDAHSPDSEEQGDSVATAPHPDDQTHLERAQMLVTASVRRWPRRYRAPSAKDHLRLSERVADELAAGGDETLIVHELTRDLTPQVKSAVNVIMGDRTSVPGWGRDNDPRADQDRYQVHTTNEWCGMCDRDTRLIGVIDPRTGAVGTMARCGNPVRALDGSRVACHPEAFLLQEMPVQDLDTWTPEEIAQASKDSLEQARSKSPSTRDLLENARRRCVDNPYSASRPT